MLSRPLITGAVLLLLGASQGGCGLRGDLYLEEDQAAKARPDRRESLREKIGGQTLAEPDPVEFDSAAEQTEDRDAGERVPEDADDGAPLQRQRTEAEIAQPKSGADSATQP